MIVVCIFGAGIRADRQEGARAASRSSRFYHCPVLKIEQPAHPETAKVSRR